MDTGIVSGMLRAPIEVIRRAFTDARVHFLSRKLLNGFARTGSNYSFSAEDVKLHARERYCRLPGISVARADDAGLLMATVRDQTIFWPAQLSREDLPWLYHEVFDPFEGNPSSYDHPLMDYGHRRWIIDAGAAEGFFSVFALGRSPGDIISVEPLASMKRALDRTLALHAKGRKAFVESSALGAGPAWAKLHVNADHVCDSKLLGAEDPGGDAGAEMATEQVRVTTIDILARQYSLAEGGMIKMDIEGHEMAALNGASLTLRDYRPTLAIAVYHEFDNARKCAEIVKRANPSYRVELRGYYGYFDPPRPYMLFAF